MNILVGIDIGGTKCALSFAAPPAEDGAPPEILHKTQFDTHPSPVRNLAWFQEGIQAELSRHPDWKLAAAGISCGGPLDSKKGIILAPPNLPHWIHVDCVSPIREAFHIPAALCNDADACALAEWRWGAGNGCDNMVFLTFGTGMGAGLILNRQLVSGGCGMAGEIGHMRLEPDGPVGHRKAGSFEGFCSGGGIAQLGRLAALRALESGSPAAYCKTWADLDSVSAKTIGKAAQAGDPTAVSVYRQSGEALGKGLAVIIDLLNPERIVIGSIYARQQELLEPPMMAVLREEAFGPSLAACSILPAGLGEKVGDYAALSVAYGLLNPSV